MQGIQIFDDSRLSKDFAIVSDSTSDLFSRKINISKYGVIFASGGKNLGPAGVTVVIVRNDILEKKRASSKLPSILSWKEYASSQPIQNLYSTPPMLSIGLSKMFLDDLAQRGGVDYAEKRTLAFSTALYEEIDQSRGFYQNSIPKGIRSRVSIAFRISNNAALEAKFISQGEKIGLLQLVNHPSVGGIRAALYNGIPTKAVEDLLVFMRNFRAEHNN
jgi:phosphoserine aminotransferase